MSKIVEIINPSYRTGISAKTQKPWVLMQLRTDDGKEATGFAPLAVGDEVTLKYDDKYKNYSAEKLTEAKAERNEIVEKLDEILTILKAGSQGREYKRVQTPPYATQEPISPSAPADDELPPLSAYDQFQEFL